MLVLGIESSCDDTAVAVVENGAQIRSSVISHQFKQHQSFGGIVPEVASRNHLKDILGTVEEALDQASLSIEEIDGIAVTRGPGLMGSLLVGVNFAKALAYSIHKPLVGVHHIEGHISSGLMMNPPFPSIALVVSGGHTNLYWVAERGVYKLLGKTRDDAAGEAFDKVAKLIGLKQPGGPSIEKEAFGVTSDQILFPRAKMPDYEFSFSGLKTAVSVWIKKNGLNSRSMIAASFQNAVIDMLVEKTVLATRQLKPSSVIVCGGVARNKLLRKTLSNALQEDSKINLYVPEPDLCTDNAVMIAAAGYQKLQMGHDEKLSVYAASNIELGSESSS